MTAPRRRPSSQEVLEFSRERQREFSSYVKKLNVCRKYEQIHDRHTGQTKDICRCGREKEWHLQRQISTDGERCNQGEKTIKPDTYGQILFAGLEQGTRRPAPYVRVDSAIDPSELWEVLHKCWKIKPPKLLISVTGGAKDFFVNPRLLNIFKRGLIKAATSTGAWIVTGGTNVGVMKYVGEAVREHAITRAPKQEEVVAIGIATWGIINNKECLLKHDGTGSFPAIYSPENYNERSIDCPIDHNHTHFIFVDNHTEGRYGVEIDVRASLVEYISKLEILETKDNNNQCEHVPVVLLVLQGGPNTLKTVATAVEKGIPVVIAEGSGKAADFIAGVIKQTESDTDISTDENAIRRDAQRMLGINKQNVLDDAVESMKHVLQHRSLVIVFNLDHRQRIKQIDEAILHALLKSKSGNAKSMLKLALAWDRCDVARKELFTMENLALWQHLDLEEYMTTALVKNRIDFVQLFLDSGFNLENYLTLPRLKGLYLQATDASTMGLLLQQLLQTMQKRKTRRRCPGQSTSVKLADTPHLLKLVGRLVNYLTVDLYESLYKGPNFVVKTEGSDVEGVKFMERTGGSSEGFPRNFEEDPHTNGQSHTQQRHDQIQPQRELFIWATLLNRRDMAAMFWKNGNDHIGGALTASALLGSLAKFADREEEGDLSSNLKKNSVFFEKLSVGVLNECYQRDKKKAHKLLEREQNVWQTRSLFNLADSTEQMEFMGHSCCQTKLTCIWMGKIALHTPVWKIIAVMFMPLFLGFIKFSNNEPPEAIEEVNDLRSKQKKRKSWRRSFLTRKPHEVTLRETGPNSPGTINVLQALHYFYTAPIVKFLYHTLAYLVYLLLFSFFVLTDLRPITTSHPPSAYEYYTWVWAASMLMEEFRQMITRSSHSLSSSLNIYFSSRWNWLDLMLYVTLLVSIILRCTLPPNTFLWAQMVYIITLVMFYLRFLQVFFIWKNIGPKVIMIKEMLYDLASFIVIMATFLLAYGISAHALQFPNALVRWDLLRHVLYQPYWNIYGELFIEKIEGEIGNCTNNASLSMLDPTVRPCPRQSWLAIIFFAIYMILTHVLLLNLLIAMFSYTFQSVQNDSEKVWKYYRYNIIQEYMDRPTLPAPLIVLSLVRRCVIFIMDYCKCISPDNSCHRDNHSRNHEYVANESEQLSMFERAGMEDYILKYPLWSKGLIDTKMSHSDDRIEKLIDDVEQIKQRMCKRSTDSQQQDLDETCRTMEENSDSYRAEMAHLRSCITELHDQLDSQTGQLIRLEDMLRQGLQEKDQRLDPESSC